MKKQKYSYYYSEEDGEGNIVWIKYNPKYYTPSTDTKKVLE